MSKPLLWIRKLSCGHERATNIAYMCKNYEKPKVGGEAYCRQCCENVTILEVYSDEEEIQKL